MSDNAAFWLQKIRDLNVSQPVRIMNVCGGHERSISMAGIRNALPENMELIPGPGCPVCVCPEEDIYQAIQLALNEDITLLAFGDMLRVPVNVKKGDIRTLAEAKATGADVRAIASPLEVLKITQQNKSKNIVFFAAGFETTISPVAALIKQGLPKNASILMSGRLTWPAISMLLNSGEAGFNCLVAPGHVATVMGANEWSFVIDQFSIPAAVAGFSAESLLAAFYSVTRQLKENKLMLDNCYSELVSSEGNLTAQQIISETLDVVDANWRGVGTLPNSGYQLNASYAHQDARLLYPDYADKLRKRSGEMPAGCDCAAVVLGKKYPNQCKLFNKTCTPRNPIGPCMVSDEGACRIWINHH